MSDQTRRIAAIAIAGAIIIVAAVTLRQHIIARRLASQGNSTAAQVPPQQIQAERELVRLHDAARTAPNDKAKQWDLANFYINNHIPDKAADQLSTIIQMDHNDLQAQLKLADMCVIMEQYAEADSIYKSITQASPKNVKALQGYTDSLIKQRRFLEAVNMGEKALVLDKNDNTSLLLHATALLHFARQYPDALAHAHELKTAETELARLSQSMPNSGEVFYEYGRVEQALMHREASITQLERAHQLIPTNGDVTRMLAVSYRAMLKDDKALKLLKEDAAIEPDSAATNSMLGIVLLDSAEPGALQMAVDAFKRAYKVAPNDASICEHLGTALEKSQDLAGARLAYERATQLNPFRAFAFQKLALIYTRLGKPILAKQAADLGRKMTFNTQQLATIIQMSAMHPREIGLHLILADRYRDMNMMGAARDEYFSVLALDPNNRKVPKQFMKQAGASATHNQ